MRIPSITSRHITHPAAVDVPMMPVLYNKLTKLTVRLRSCPPQIPASTDRLLMRMTPPVLIFVPSAVDYGTSRSLKQT